MGPNRQRLVRWLQRAQGAGKKHVDVRLSGDDARYPFEIPEGPSGLLRDLAADIEDTIGEYAAQVSAEGMVLRLQGYDPDGLAMPAVEGGGLAAAAAAIPRVHAQVVRQQMILNERFGNTMLQTAQAMVEQSNAQAAQCVAITAQNLGALEKMTAMVHKLVEAREEALDRSAERKAMIAEQTYEQERRQFFWRQAEKYLPEFVERAKYGATPSMLAKLATAVAEMRPETLKSMQDDAGPVVGELIQQIMTDFGDKLQRQEGDKKAAE